MSDSDRGKRSQALGQAFSILIAFALVAMIVGTLAFSQGKEWERRNQHPANYAESAKEAAQRACVGTEATAVFECVSEKVEASQEQAQSEQDLDAQQGMKFWAAVMAILAGATALITGIGVWYVKRTLETNEGFVKESQDATKAMIRQNELTEAAQRPWIAVKAEIASIKVGETLIGLDFNVSFSNVGKMIAENFYGSVQLVPMGEPLLLHLKERFDGFQLEEGIQKRATAMIPGQSFTYPAQITYAIDHLPWCEVAGYRKDCFFMVLAMSRYRIPGEDRWRYSMQSFALGERRDHIDSYKLIHDSIHELTEDNSVLRPLGMTRAT